MPRPDPLNPHRRFYLALALSLLIHGLVLVVPQRPPEIIEASAPPMRARLAPRAPSPATPPSPPATAKASPTPAKPRPKTEILALEKSKARTPTRTVPPQPKWSPAEKEEMNRFLDELDTEAKRGPDLSQRARAMAEAMARQPSRRDDDDELLQRRPNSPPVSAFSLELYLESLVKKLNRSAQFVQNDPRARGFQTAEVRVRINPDGSLKSFEVVDAADQQVEIQFIRAVVNQAAPFAAFPPDIERSAQSLTMVICIRPASPGGGGFGFSRLPAGRHC